MNDILSEAEIKPARRHLGYAKSKIERWKQWIEDYVRVFGGSAASRGTR